MRLLPSVVQAEHLGDFRLRVVFNDGSNNTIDFSQWFDDPIFEARSRPTKARPLSARKSARAARLRG